MPAQALAAAAVLASFAASGNRVDIKLDRGAAAVTWYSPATFRFQRTLDQAGQTSSGGPLGTAGLQAGQSPATSDPPQKVDFTVDDLPGTVRIRSKVLEVTVQKRGALVSVSRIGGDVLMQDLTEPVAAPNRTVTWDRAMPPGVRYYAAGGGPTGLDMDRRGQAQIPNEFVLISSAGYGESHIPAGWGQYDFSKPDRYSVAVPRVDYFFYYGPTPAKVFKELDANKVFRRCPEATEIFNVPVGPGSSGWPFLRAAVLGDVNLSISGCPSFGAYGFDLGMYASAPAEILQRALQFGSLAQKVYHGAMPLSDFRMQLESFFYSYAYETNEEGLPLWRPLPFQFPDDPESARHADEFMLGDEMLIAPIYTASDKRPVYLPPGIWTNLATNEELQGRRTIEIETKGLPVFARNGTVIPLDSANGMALHYFPKLGAEFFILEKDVNAWTQVHAAPAADAMRLEIESRVARDYEWVVHHVERPSGVGFEERKYVEAASREAMAAQGWFYDAGLKNLHVRASVAAGEDRVIHVGW
jgi:hypothetical protein